MSEEYDLQETLEILSDKQAVADIKQGLLDMKLGKTISLEDFLKKYPELLD